jgi:hypothetical protein
VAWNRYPYLITHSSNSVHEILMCKMPLIVCCIYNGFSGTSEYFCLLHILFIFIHIVWLSCNKINCYFSATLLITENLMLKVFPSKLFFFFFFFMNLSSFWICGRHRNLNEVLPRCVQKLWKVTKSFVMAVCLHGTTQLPLKDFNEICYFSILTCC